MEVGEIFFWTATINQWQSSSPKELAIKYLMLASIAGSRANTKLYNEDPASTVL